MEYREIGFITGAHGVNGEVKVIPLTDDPYRYDILKWVYIDVNNSLKKYVVESVKYHKKLVIVKINGINDMDTAKTFRNCYLKVNRQNVVKLPADSYFISDILNCDVLECNGNMLGKIIDVIKTGSNDVYIVEGKDKKEILIPALKSIVKEISIDEGKIVVSLPKGLIQSEI